MRSLATDRDDRRPLLAPIVGCQDLHAESMSGTGKRRILEHAEQQSAVTGRV